MPFPGADVGPKDQRFFAIGGETLSSGNPEVGFTMLHPNGAVWLPWEGELHSIRDVPHDVDGAVRQSPINIDGEVGTLITVPEALGVRAACLEPV